MRWAPWRVDLAGALRCPSASPSQDNFDAQLSTGTCVPRPGSVIDWSEVRAEVEVQRAGHVRDHGGCGAVVASDSVVCRRALTGPSSAVYSCPPRAAPSPNVCLISACLLAITLNVPRHCWRDQPQNTQPRRAGIGHTWMPARLHCVFGKPPKDEVLVALQNLDALVFERGRQNFSEAYRARLDSGRSCRARWGDPATRERARSWSPRAERRCRNGHRECPAGDGRGPVRR